MEPIALVLGWCLICYLYNKYKKQLKKRKWRDIRQIILEKYHYNVEVMKLAGWDLLYPNK